MNGEIQQYCIHALAKRLRILPASYAKDIQQYRQQEQKQTMKDPQCQPSIPSISKQFPAGDLECQSLVS